MSLTFDLHRTSSPVSDERRAEIHANPGFGVHFTDHMVRAVWTKDGGWGDGRVEPYGPIQLMPSAAVLLGLLFGQVILVEASLGFLGLGDPNALSWGLLAGQAQGFLRVAWWLAVFPGLAIAVAVLGINLLADALAGVLGSANVARTVSHRGKP